MRILLILSLFYSSFISGYSQEMNGNPRDIEYSDIDEAIVRGKMERFKSSSALSTGELTYLIGKDFLHTPYGSKILDKNLESENLVINVRELDCTTFVEISLALARTIKNGNLTFDFFTKELEKIRYEGGIRKDFTSRLHYFSQWIVDNENKGIVKDVTQEIGGIPYPVDIHFMSSNPQLYPQLQKFPVYVEEMKTKEKNISSQSFYYIPKNDLSSMEEKIQDGDLAAITTNKEGLDITHVGIMFRQNNRIYFIHASSILKKVVISSSPFSEYLNKIGNNTGVMVIRPQ